MRVDAPRSVVEDRPHVQSTLELTPALLDAQQLLVTESEVLRGQGIVVGRDDPLAVVALGILNCASVEHELSGRSLAEVLAESAARAQRACALGVALAFLLLKRAK